MSAILYPIATNAERALASPVGRAAREREAQDLARGEVRFVTEPAGPAFGSYEEALKIFGGRIDDGVPGHTVQPQDRYCTLREVLVQPPGKRSRGKQARPVYKDGRRWSAPPEHGETVWRLSISYWRVVGAEELAALDQARKARRKAGAAMDAATLRALAHQPLQPVRPQQPLDVGLFEFRPPEAPHILMPDE